MISEYKVSINGTAYEVTVEVIKRGNAGSLNTPPAPPASYRPAPRPVSAESPTAAPVAASAPTAAPVPATSAPAPASASAPTAAPASGQTISAPMPGIVQSIHIQAGSVVKEGDLLLVFEAMKMENEILAPCDGTVLELKVAQGATLESGTPLCVIG